MTDLSALLDEVEAVLGRIVKWQGEFPATGLFHQDGTEQSYGWCYGSNGERDFMRALAADALAKLKALKQGKPVGEPFKITADTPERGFSVVATKDVPPHIISGDTYEVTARSTAGDGGWLRVWGRAGNVELSQEYFTALKQGKEGEANTPQATEISPGRSAGRPDTTTPRLASEPAGADDLVKRLHARAEQAGYPKNDLYEEAADALVLLSVDLANARSASRTPPSDAAMEERKWAVDVQSDDRFQAGYSAGFTTSQIELAPIIAGLKAEIAALRDLVVDMNDEALARADHLTDIEEEK